MLFSKIELKTYKILT